MRRSAILCVGVFVAGMFFAPLPAFAREANEDANRTFVEAIKLVRRANVTLDTREAVRLLRGADDLIKKIIADYPESTLAVQLSTNQFIGDFDYMEFKSRIRGLSCERGSYVEDFLSEYGISTATGPTTEACFLYRTETLMTPIEEPLTAARPDWLSLAVAYYLYGQQERAREIVLPFLSLLRKSSATPDTQDSFVFLARTLALTGAFDQALRMAERINDCTNRLNLVSELMKITLSQGDNNGAKLLADQIKDYVDTNQCNWQKGLAAQALFLTDRKGDAKIIYEKAAAEQYSAVKPEERAETTPPDLVMAAGLMDDPATTIAMLRAVMDRNPWVVAPALEELAEREYYAPVMDFVDDIKEPERRAEAYAALISVFVKKNESKRATSLMSKLNEIHVTPAQAFQQSQLLALKAYAEKQYYKDERWRDTFQSAVNAAERVDEENRTKLLPPLLATLMQIKTNKRMLGD